MSGPGNGKALVAIDGSEMSRRILEHVRTLPAIHNTEVIIYHVRPLAYSGAATREVGPPAEISTEEAAEELTQAGIHARALEEQAFYGDIAKLIVDTANRESANMIVVGSRGLSRLPAFILGSVAYKVLHLATQPVLVIPSEN